MATLRGPQEGVGVWTTLLGLFLPVLAVWPVHPPEVVAGFAPPPAAWAAGHRGLDFTARAGDPVWSVRSGLVTFAGTVAGKPVVAIALPDGRRLTYEPVEAQVSVGEAVDAGQLLGSLTDHGGHCAGRCLHLGLRIGEVYLDPMSVLPRPPAVLKPLRGLLSPRMGLAEGRPQSLHRHVRVALGGGQGGVAEEFLHGAQVRTPFENVGGRGVPEPVRSEFGPSGRH